MKKIWKLALCLVLFLGVAAHSPETAAAAKEAVYNGMCGPQAGFTIEAVSGILIIDGKGAMFDFKAGKSPFAGRKDIRAIYIGDSITEIGTWAFYDCCELESVKLGKSVKTIKDSAFYGCVSVNSVTMPEGLSVIEDRAFEHCIAWKDIRLPESVTEIGAWAFDDTGYYRDRKNWEKYVLYFGTFLYSARYNLKYLDSSLRGEKKYVSDVHKKFEYPLKCTIPER